MSDDFLTRWSRRKREARREEEARAPAAAPEPEAPAPAAAPEPPSGGEPELTPEDIAALPPIEELTAESDFSAFLRRGVPEKLKNAALRRMWALDPAIRDHVGDARDYAFDWNVPGGVPGNGPLPAAGVEAMLRGIFGDGAGGGNGPAPASDPLRRGESSQAWERNDARTSESPAGDVAASEEEQLAGSDVLARRRAAFDEDPVALPPSSEGASEAKNRVDPAEIAPPRRHGGAKPV